MTMEPITVSLTLPVNKEVAELAAQSHMRLMQVASGHLDDPLFQNYMMTNAIRSSETNADKMAAAGLCLEKLCKLSTMPKDPRMVESMVSLHVYYYWVQEQIDKGLVSLEEVGCGGYLPKGKTVGEALNIQYELPIDPALFRLGQMTFMTILEIAARNVMMSDSFQRLIDMSPKLSLDDKMRIVQRAQRVQDRKANIPKDMTDSALLAIRYYLWAISTGADIPEPLGQTPDIDDPLVNVEVKHYS